MNKESIYVGLIGLLLGVIVAGFGASYAVNSQDQNMMRLMGIRDRNGQSEVSHDMMDHSTMSMDDMASSLNNKTGDDFDRLFIAQMIDHHQGAIDMAQLAKKNAKHDEIKKLSEEIIVAQTKEISQMRQWQKDWGY